MLHHRRHGDSPQVLILIPGLGMTHASWRLLIRTLMAEYTVITVDNRGAGQTPDDGSVFSIEDMADDIITVADHLGCQRFRLAGHSMGGAIALTVAYRHPERVVALALCNTFMQSGGAVGRLSDQIGALYAAGATEEQVMEMIVSRVFSTRFMTPQRAAVVKSSWHHRAGQQSGFDYHRQALALRNFNSSSWISSVRVPTLVIDSAEDLLSRGEDADHLARLITGATRTTLAGGHASPIEQPAALSAALLSFFQTRTPLSG